MSGKVESKQINRAILEVEIQQNGVAVVSTDTINFIGATVTEDPTGVAKVTITGVTFWTESESSATQQNTRWIPNNAAADVSAVIQPKGTGANLAQRPDGAAAGGNARGQYATDWQKSRSNAAHVASGNQSTIGGGRNNQATGLDSTISGGRENNASGINANISGAYRSTASGQYTSIGGGDGNQATAYGSVVCGGVTGVASGVYAVVVGGQNNTANASYAEVSGGRYSLAYIQACRAKSGGSLNSDNSSDAQLMEVVAGRKAALAASGTMQAAVDYSGSVFATPQGAARWMIMAEHIVTVVAITGTATGITVGDTWAQMDAFAIKKDAGVVTQVGAITNLFQQNDAGLAGSTITYAYTTGTVRPTYTAPAFAGGGTITVKINTLLYITEVTNTNT